MQEPLASSSDSIELVQKQDEQHTLLKIFCKQNPNLNVAARGDKAILVPNDDDDKSQLWLQYMDFGTLTDDQGRRAFALVNKATGQALSNRNNAVQLVPYTGDVAVELSMLWSLGVQRADGYTEVRTLKDTSKTLNGMYGGVRDGTLVGTYDSSPGHGNAVWKMDPVPMKK